MGTKGTTSYKIGDPNALHYITIAVVEWLDIFTRRNYKDIIIESLAYCRKEKGFELFGYVIMTNHIHLICRAKEGFELSDILRDFKRHTAKYIIKEIQENSQESRRDWLLEILQNAGDKNSKNKTYQFWRQDNHPIVLCKPKTIQQKLKYIHFNPVEDGYVANPEDYIYSSARNYAAIENILEIDYI
ncbi:MAG: transposase [Bacteroidales bacterium]|nr:transposase [Bacteroidales bacterium]